ncbi:methyltransferase domain-containing protein [Sulfuritalea hydrogenivorans]|uniref:Malonyl-[acyl-carrier protein] O-methyltransferase n=1 Tax=Sulfuritalea hydrogenivorans sk43H TaxID=1223802 RepID=W0SBY9_9PROT|nr:methyltransferase domain-containing protein [Sulfuritalea hydrogenivorans]BAO28546.1 biotin synthesis protein [Sulfuritalea hydrogenivorans sk43H]
MRDDFARAAESYDSAAVLAREVGARMAARLDLVKIAPARVADIGCATGDGIRELQQRYPKAQALAVDYALPMLRAVKDRTPLTQRIMRRAPRLVNADVRALPLAANSLGLVWSNLMLHWLDDPLPALRELHRVLEVGGLLSFATLGPDTLKELRAAAAKVGAGDTARRFLDMHDLGDMLVAAGFGDPVMDMELVTLTYAAPRAFLADQRHLGVRDALLGHQGWRDWRRLLGAWPRDAEGRLPASFEIVHGHAWKPEPRQIADGRAVVKFHSR